MAKTPATSSKASTRKTSTSKASSKTTASSKAKTSSKRSSTKPAATPSAKAAAKSKASKSTTQSATIKSASKAQPTSKKVTKSTATTQAPLMRAHEDAELNKTQVAGLHQKLIAERERLMRGFDRHVQEALNQRDMLSDEIDIAQRSTEQAYLFRFADKERKLLIEIEHALDKMKTGEYGICEGTDEPIGFKRLEVRPWTRFSVAYKERLELDKAQHRR